MTTNGKDLLSIALCSVKGGVGKTCIAILLGNYFAAAGRRVCLIDTDLNNSLSFYYLDGEGFARSKKLNIAAAIADEENSLADFALGTKRENISLIASTPHLSDLRTVNEKRLARMLPSLYGKYDIAITDCHPTYDNLVLNAVNAADYVITPVLKDTFSYNTAKFLGGALARDTDKAGNWFVLLNGYSRRFEDSAGGRQKEFTELYGEFPLTPKETWLPWTSVTRGIVDYGRLLAREKTGRAGTVCGAELYEAVGALADCLLPEGESLVPPEAF
jgi:chromosome partitioning protein